MSDLIESGNIEIAVNEAGESYSIKTDKFSFIECLPDVLVDGKSMGGKWGVVSSGSDDVVMECSNTGGKWQLKIEKTENSSGVSGVKLQLSGNLKETCRKLRLIPLSVNAFSADHLLVHGRKMGGCSAHLLSDSDDIDFTSHFMLMLTSGNEKLQITQPLNQDNLSELSGSIMNNRINNLTAYTDIEFAETGEVISEEISIFAENDGYALMYAYGDKNKADREFTPEPAGWNSWDYYRWTITEDEVMENAEFIKNDPVLSKHVKRIIVDDGWQYCYGEWEANHLFPHGMEWLAKELTDMGFDPGLWFAPGILEPHARISQWDTEMLAMGESGLPCLGYSCMERYGMLLDPTHPKSQKWLEDLFSKYAAFGYKYFKLDFLAQTMNARKFYDNSTPRGRIINKLVEPIRKATLGKAKILGCNYQFEAGTDLVDTVRVSSDIHALWHAVEKNVFSIAGRFWSHNKLWVNDPDFAVCRGEDTSDDPDLKRLKCAQVFVRPENPSPGPVCDMVLADINEEEAKTLMGLVIISGGVVNLSDKMTRLNDKGLDIARRTVSAFPGEAGVPLDLFTAVHPTKWLQKIAAGYRVMLINWGEKEAELSIDLNKEGINISKARNFWKDEDIAVSGGILKQIIKPHGSVIVELT
ncbi:MAG: alpha-amylase family protein [Planctomycetota bacterium]|jgi:hypothetical protein